MLKPILLFLLGFICLIKGGDWFVDGASALAKKLHIPELIIGATVVSIGTTLPEVMVSATAAVEGHGEIAYGNAIGSVICNTSLIAAITLVFRPSFVNKKALRIPVLFFFGAAAVYMIAAYALGRFSRPIGIVLLAGFVGYILLLVYQSRKGEQAPEEAESGEEEEALEMTLLKMLVLLIVGAALIAVGARLLVDNGTIIAEKLGVPESVIALTFVALGTSLPELVTAISSLIKGHGALSLGNIIGANIFNLVLVSGLSTTLSPFNVPSSKLFMGMNTSLLIEIPLMVTVMLILTVPPLVRGKLARWQGILLLLIYAAFVTFQFAA